MSSAKSSRSRASVPSGVVSANPDAQENLGDKLKVFKTEKFDPDSYVQSKCQSMNEKEIRQLCTYLLDLKKASAEEMRKSVYANYAAFIRTSKEISDLEGELLSIRNLLSTQAALIHGLAEGVHVDTSSFGPEGSKELDLSILEDREHSDIEEWSAAFPDILDVLLAERRVDEALAALDEGEHVAAEAEEKRTLSPASLSSLQIAISEHRQKLADQLADAACQPSTRGVELRGAVSALKRLGDGPRAHTLLLNAHYQRFQYNMQGLRPSSTSYGGAYTAALSQLVFSAIAQAATDSLAVFGEESAYSSELVMWATKQTEAFALLVKRHALASSAAAGGLRAAAECVQIALHHCSLLEAHGLALCPVLVKLFRPSVEQALDANLKRIEESTAAFAAADDWVLTQSPAGTRRSSNASIGTGIAFQTKLSSSAHRFNSMVQDFFEDVGPLISMQLGGPTLEGLLHVFNSYVNLLINALPGSMDEDGNQENSLNKIVRIAETEAQQMALLANASLLADDLLPRAVMKLSPSYGKDEPRRRVSERQNRMPEQREWKRRLQRCVDGLRDNFCQRHILDLIFTEEGDTNLGADMYLSLDGNVDEPDWFPSPVFQELFAKLNTMASIAADMFVGRDRFATQLLMRLTETFMLCLSNDQSFWDDIEEGPKPLGPFGLQQFLLDMQFVILFSSQGRYLSRHLHGVIKDLMGRAVNALYATGIDPYRPQTTIGTAMVLCHRFFVRRSHACHDRFLIATASLFLAAKSEETHRPLNDVLKSSCEIHHKHDLAFPTYLPPFNWFEQYRERVIEAEQMILTTLNFELSVQHPYIPLTSALNKLGLSQSVMVNLAWNLVSEGLRSSLWLQFKPHHIAAGAAFLAAKILNFDLSSHQSLWQEFQTTPSILQDVVKQLMELF